ncbi:MAG: translocation and assembly module TamB [Gammaproteobacteria bacterium]|jgi:translocation and assembly module TamB
MRLRRLMRSATAAALGFAFICALTFTIIVTNEAASRWAIAIVIKPYAQQVSIASINGRLWDRLVFDTVRIRTDQISGSIEQVTFEWQLVALLSGQLIVDSVVFEGTDLTITLPQSDPNAEPILELPASPLPVTLQRFDFHRLNIRLGERTLAVDKLGFGATWDAHQIVLRRFDLIAYGQTFSLNAVASIGLESTVDASAAWSGELADKTAQGSLKVTGPLSDLKFESLIDAQVSATVNGTLEAFAESPQYSLTGTIAPTDFGNGLHIESTTIGLVGTFESLRTTIETQVDTLQTDPYALSLTANFDNSGSKSDSIAAEIKWQAVPQKSSDTTISGAGQFQFDNNTIYVNHTVNKPYATHLAGEIHTGAQTLDLELSWRDIHHTFADGRSLDSPSGTLRATGTFNDMQVALQSAMSMTGVGPVDVVARGQLARKSFKLDMFEAVLLGGMLKSQTVEVDVAAQALNLELGWHDIHHKFADGRSLDSPFGTIRATGAFNELEIELRSAIRVTDIGPVDIGARGRIAKQSFKLDALEAVLLGGTIETQGTYEFGTEPSGALTFSGKGLDLSAIRPATQSRINFVGSASFENTGAGFMSRVQLDDMSGFVRGQPLSGAAIFETKPGRVTIEHARVRTGRNKLEIAGTWAQKIDGRFVVDLPDLSVFDAGADGQLTGTGRLSGDLDLPKVKAVFTGKSVRLNELSLGSLNVNIDVDSDRSTASHADFVISDLIYQREKLDALKVELQGTAQSHTIHFNLDGPELTADGSAYGAVKSRAWTGLLNSFNLSSKKFSQWSLRDPSAITVSADASSLANACLEAKEGLVCIAADRSPDIGNAKISLLGLPLALADPYLPVNLTLGGKTDGLIEVHLAGDMATGEGTLKIRDGVLKRDKGSGAVDVVPIDKFALDFEILADKLQATASAIVGEWFSLTAEADWERVEDGNISILVDASAPDVTWFQDFIPQLSGSHGAMELHSKVSGKVAAPRVETKLKLSNGALAIPDIGLNIDSLAVQVSGDTSKLNVDAAIGSASRRLNLTGLVSRFDESDYRYDLTLRGDAFPALRTPEIEADISPDLQLVGNMKALDVVGTLNVPKVFVDIKHLPNSSVRVSGDQIIVAADGTAIGAEATSSFVSSGLSGNVDILLGDAISINGFGLSSKLSGNLKWTKRRGSTLGRADGTILIDEGAFDAYGQNLQIKTGHIQFVGPIDNPRLALQALRPDIPIKAGVNVSGTVRKPKISLFSQPVLSDGNILSYIVTGHGLGEAAASDAGLLTQAALSLGAEESAAVTNQIRNAFGIDEFSIASGETARDTSLVAGKRLSPKLTVRTGFNPFDQLWSFFLNYKLTDHWSIETESGDRQGADILYSIEREELLDGTWFD